jgi:hypothetical protein
MLDPSTYQHLDLDQHLRHQHPSNDATPHGTEPRSCVANGTIRWLIMYTIVDKLPFTYRLFCHMAPLMTPALEQRKWKAVQPDRPRPNEPHAIAVVFRKSDALDRIRTI